MRAIVHRTPGLLDLRSLTVMGLSVKPRSDNPIGMFGTGLKYAVATLCRLGCSPVLWIGHDKYTFVGRRADFRGAEYTKLRMRCEKPGWARPRYVELPFTTEYGKFWTAWMAFRELESNTRDEHGETFLVDDEHPHLGAAGALGVGGHTLAHFGARDAVGGADDETRFVIDLEEYVAAWTFQDETFLKGAMRAPTEGKDMPLQIVDGGPRDKLYWRGLRVKDLKGKETVQCWNHLMPMKLTEDRTLEDDMMAKYHLTRWIAEVCNDRRIITDVITADADKWEHRLPFDAWAAQPSPLFMETAQLEQNRGRTHGLGTYISRHVPTPAGATPWERHPRPWRYEPDDHSITDAQGIVVLARPHEPPLDWEQLARAVVARINGEERAS